MKTLEDLFLNELADMYDAEHRILKALPKMAKAATCSELKKAFQSHLEESGMHVKMLGQIFESLGKPAKGKKCEAIVGLLKEGDELVAEFKGTPALDAALIAAAQKVEHYEIASHGCLHQWAETLGHQTACDLLGQILKEEKGANDALNELAHTSVNAKAMGEPVGAEA